MYLSKLTGSFSQFLKSWIEVFVDYFYLSITLGVMGAEKMQ